MTRTFQARLATRESAQPLLIGLMGPPGAGKTYSALTLAEGMRQVSGDDPVLIDTECGRSTKYADTFRFQRIDFRAPFRSTDFLAAVYEALKSNPAAIIVDSISDEHEGDGGVLDQHDQELDRMAGDDWAKRERVGQASWVRPKAGRREMINGLLQITTPLIFCFRAREKVKQVADARGRMVPTNMGYQPIAPSEIVFAMDVTCVLPPKSDGVPIWKSDKMGEEFVIKLPSFFRSIFVDGKPITAETGRALAAWAKGSPPSASSAATAAPPTIDPGSGAAPVDESDLVFRYDAALTEAAKEGMAALKDVWADIPSHLHKILKVALDTRHKPAAELVDRERSKQAQQ